MTKHNIREHLNWLIQNTSDPPQPAHAPPSTGVASALHSTLEYHQSSQRIEPSSHGLQDAITVTKDAESLCLEPQFARPALPASVLKAQSSDPMGRLQAGSKTSHKPRLFSETISLSLQPSGASNVRTPGLSLHDQYNERFGPKTPGTDGMKPLHIKCAHRDFKADASQPLLRQHKGITKKGAWIKPPQPQ